MCVRIFLAIILALGLASASSLSEQQDWTISNFHKKVKLPYHEMLEKAAKENGGKPLLGDAKYKLFQDAQLPIYYLYIEEAVLGFLSGASISGNPQCQVAMVQCVKDAFTMIQYHDITKAANAIKLTIAS